MAGEGEGEAQRQPSAFHPHVVQEVGNAMHDVVKELEKTITSCAETAGNTNISAEEGSH